MTMSATLSFPAPRRVADYLAEETVCLLLGGALTFGIFFAIARFESVRPVAPPSDIEDLRVVSAFTEPPPPRPEERTEQDTTPPLTGIEIAASDSSVKLAVVPPDLDKIIPSEDLPPKATIQFNQLMPELRPKAGISGDFERIYQQNEVDQAPKAVVQKIARVNTRARDGAEELKVNLLLVIGLMGEVQSIRVIRPSGNSKFDKIVLECVRDEWEFSPAVNKGKKVRCMVQQQVWYKWTGGNSPFTL
jgi:TonB family protein